MWKEERERVWRIWKNEAQEQENTPNVNRRQYVKSDKKVARTMSEQSN